MLTIHEKGMLKKTAQMLNKALLPGHESPADWDRVKADLEGLSTPQLNLVLQLIEKMKEANKANS